MMIRADLSQAEYVTNLRAVSDERVCDTCPLPRVQLASTLSHQAQNRLHKYAARDIRKG